ncbi:unnamed protein product [Mytilus edulis]|uniref:Tyr recombinase domain-containing protein n=1 Tax=Mytilus edulis TaxID=6550 RepID=A0A8S3Q789_MYTED|nr:unnamed protein product [Mytilus edulis]
MSSVNQEFRAVLPRRVKKSIDYRVFDQLGMQSDAVTAESEVGDELVHGAAGGSDSMSKVDFEDLKERLSIYMDSEESDTDEETKELVRKLKEVKQKEKVMKNKKRKELEFKGASKPKKEKSGKKVEQSKKGKDKCKSKDTDKDKGKDKDKDKDSVKDSKGDELLNLSIKHLRKDTKTKKIVDKHMKQMLATESNSESDSSINSSTGSGSEPIFLSSSDSDSETTHKKINKHKKKKVRADIKDKPHDKIKIEMNWPQSELKYEFTNRKAVEFRQITLSQFCAGELEIIRHCKISTKEREDSNKDKMLIDKVEISKSMEVSKIDTCTVNNDNDRISSKRVVYKSLPVQAALNFEIDEFCHQHKKCLICDLNVNSLDLQYFVDIQREIKLSVEKASSPSTVMKFLGVKFGTTELAISVTTERVEEILLLVKTWLNLLVARVKQLQSLLGKLHFVSNCVRPGRVFVSMLLTWLRSLPDDKCDHIIPLYIRKDLLWWYHFLKSYNAVSMITLEDWSQPDEILETDATLSGCGGWFLEKRKVFSCPISVLFEGFEFAYKSTELIALMISVKVWSVHFVNRKIVLEMHICNVVEEKFCFMLQYNFEIKAVHFPGVENRTADILSRWHSDSRFEELFYELPVVKIEKEFDEIKQICRGDIIIENDAVNAYKNMIEAIPAVKKDLAYNKVKKGRILPIIYKEYQNKLRYLIQKTGRNSLFYSTHSFRRGGASLAFDAEVSTELIQLHGDWHSDAYKKYLQFTLEQNLQVSQMMSKSVSL